eukprot:CAMPEP_0172209194 /NCGR_PEP_ID=MMETSP1050-20130122/34962_1 /TAXON_ID=233186 /ORGANISM="Cryptomonas curvata, Strain CCAP979/52" /LENGTH=443 /DNA_ID=CAMNT_0012889009 /DNA_START=58 /DNA_END=1385 /DNA_ORIENTATION=-
MNFKLKRDAAAARTASAPAPHYLRVKEAGRGGAGWAREERAMPRLVHINASIDILQIFVFLHSLLLVAAFIPLSTWAGNNPRLTTTPALRRLITGRSFPAMNLFQNLANTLKGGGAPAAASSPLFSETVSAPSWDTLLSTAKETEIGSKLTAQKELREKGLGPTHTDNKVRLFGAKSEEEIRVVLYRDAAAWCPYCQKVWLLLEEKQIPFRIEKINMRSYGDKPEWFLQKVPRGLLPAIELDGRLITESIVIMQILDETFPERPMLPRDSAGRRRADELMRLERALFGDWCGYVFQPGEYGRAGFEATLDRVDAALRSTAGPWFLGGDEPGIVDFQYISHVERMVPSALYWKGLRIRCSGRWAGIDAWLAAFEARPTYLATKSDYFTHVMDIPPQYGPGQPVPAGEAFRRAIDGRDGWTLPLPALSAESLEPVLPFCDPGDPG